MASNKSSNGVRVSARFLAVVVGAAAVLFAGIQMLPLLDGGRPYNDVMPVIEIEEVPIRSASPAGDAAMELHVVDCAGQPMVEQLSESENEIRVRVVAQVDGDPAECPATVRVQLQQPLGERDVIDLSTERLVEQP